MAAAIADVAGPPRPVGVAPVRNVGRRPAATSEGLRNGVEGGGLTGGDSPTAPAGGRSDGPRTDGGRRRAA